MAEKYDAQAVARGLTAIAAANGSVRQAARDTGLPRSTLKGWKSGRLPRGVRCEEVQAAEPEAGRKLAAEFREVKRLYMQHLRKEEVVAKSSALQAATVVGIFEDKAVRAEGGATSRTEQLHVSLIAPDALRSLSKAVIEATPDGPVLRRADGQPAQPEPLTVIGGRSEDGAA